MTHNSSLTGAAPPNRGRDLRGLWRKTLAIMCGLLMLLVPINVASATHDQPASDASSGDCQEDGLNVECNGFGRIQMPTTKNLKGSPVTLAAEITLSTNYEDRDARWIMFSMRNITEDRDSPVTIGLKSFKTPSGDVVTTRKIQDDASELDLWVDVLDLPVGEPITFEVEVGATERGAFAVETIVIPFDRGYDPIKDNKGEAVSLYSSTLLAVNGATTATASGDDGSFIDGNKIPGAAAGLTALLLAGTALVLTTGRKR